MAGYIIDQTTRQAYYERMEQLTKVTNNYSNPELVINWFNKMESDNCIVTCTKFNCKFHKKHCVIKKELENNTNDIIGILDKMTDCNECLCLLVSEIKKEL